MTPIIESNEEDPTHHDLDGLDALWANFRLPIPIATKGKYPTDDGNNGYSFAKHHDEWLLQALDLLRLLHTMNQQYANPKAAAQIRRLSCATVPRDRRMKGQITLAYSSLAKLERTFPVHDVDDDANQAFYQNCHGVLQQLRMDTEETCDKFQRWLDRRPQQQQMPPERDLIYDIFLAPDPESKEEEQREGMLDEFDEDGEGDECEEDFTDNNTNTPSSSPIQSQRRHHQSQSNKNQKEVDPEEFQKQQQELLEEELADMAERLKSSTLAMNATLQTQTKELDVMEDLAQANLDTVTDTAKKVEDRLTKKKGWKKKIATWSLIGTVLGMWVICFMIMRTVPKRRLGKVPNWFGRGSLFDKGLGKAKEGGTRVWKTLESLLSGEEVGPSGMPTAWERGRAQEEWENQQRRRKIKEEREEQARRWHEQQRQREGQQRKKQQQEEVQEECEILGDGTQVCSNAKDEALAREIAAERKKRRIEERMANAPAVEAVDYVEEEEETDSFGEKEDNINDANSHDEKDPMGCIPPNDEIHLHENAVDSLSKALSQIEKMLDESSEGTTQRIQLSRQYEKLQAEHKKHASMLEMERNKARSVFWAERENRIKARDLNRALGSVAFCEGGAEEDGTVGGGESSPDLEDKGNDSERYARHETARKKAEEERKLRHEKFQEEARRAEEAQQKAETEMKRLEQARAAAKAAKRKEDMERKKARLEEAERQKRELEEERLAAEASRQEDLAKLEQERRERERILEEQRKKHEGEARRLVEEEARLEANRLEQENLAAEAAKKDELRRLREEQMLAERKKKEEEEARRLTEEEARLEAERLEQERLAVEAAEQAELERLEQERVEQDILMVEQREKEKEEARRLAEEEARLEAERLEQERLSAEEAKQEEKARQRSNAVTHAEAEARRAIELSTEIAADNLDFLPSDVRLAAGRIKNELLAHYISTSPEMVDASDRSGWRPIHEAARAGNLGGIQLLVDAGCDLTLKTGRSGKGGTALWWAIQRYGEDHNVVRLLRFHGALEDGPS